MGAQRDSNEHPDASTVAAAVGEKVHLGMR